MVPCRQLPKSFLKEMDLMARLSIKWCSPGLLLYAQNEGGVRCIEGPANILMLGLGQVWELLCVCQPQPLLKCTFGNA